MAEKKAKRAKRKKEDDALLNQLKLLQADFDNYKKRVEKERKESAKLANAELIKKMLPILDDFSKAVKLSKDEGIRLIYENLMKLLKKEGLEPIDSVGRQFDINLHEAVMIVKGKGKNEEIVDELEKGYVFNGRVIRHAKVIVNKE